MLFFLTKETILQSSTVAVFCGFPQPFDVAELASELALRMWKIVD